MAQVRGIYGSGTESENKKKKKNTPKPPVRVESPVWSADPARAEQEYRETAQTSGPALPGSSRRERQPIYLPSEEFDRLWYEDEPDYWRKEKLRRMKNPKSPEEAAFDQLWYEDDPDYQAWQRSRDMSADSARQEQLAARNYYEQRERAEREQMARDSSVQSAREEQLAARTYLAGKEREEVYDQLMQASIDANLAACKQDTNCSGVDYNENAWDWFTKNSNMYSPYQDVWESLNKKPESHLKTVAEWLLNNPNYYSPHHEIWESLENTPNAYQAVKDYFTSAISSCGR